MKRTVLIVLALSLSACTRDPDNLLRPAKGETYIIDMQPGDSPPMRLKGGAYQITALTTEGCDLPLAVSLRAFKTREVIIEGRGDTLFSRRAENVQAGLYYVTAEPIGGLCRAEVNVFPD